MNTLKVLGVLVLLACARIESALPGPDNHGDIKIWWGTYDSIVTDYQAIFFWVRIDNNSDSSMLIVGPGSSLMNFCIEVGEHCVSVGKAQLEGFRVSRGNRYFLISGFRIWRLPFEDRMRPLRGKWRMTTNFADTAINEDPDVMVASPGNPNLIGFFKYTDSLLQYVRMKRSVNSMGDSTRADVFCEDVTHYLDSLKANGLADGVSYPMAKMIQASPFCPKMSRLDVDDEATETWPHFRDANRCAANARKQKKDPERECLLVKRDQNSLTERLVKLGKYIPGPDLGPYKFFNGQDTTVVPYGTWFGDVGRGGE